MDPDLFRAELLQAPDKSKVDFGIQSAFELLSYHDQDGKTGLSSRVAKCPPRNQPGLVQLFYILEVRGDTPPRTINFLGARIPRLETTPPFVDEAILVLMLPSDEDSESIGHIRRRIVVQEIQQDLSLSGALRRPSCEKRTKGGECSEDRSREDRDIRECIPH